MHLNISSITYGFPGAETRELYVMGVVPIYGTSYDQALRMHTVRMYEYVRVFLCMYVCIYSRICDMRRRHRMTTPHAVSAAAVYDNRVKN